MRKQQHTATGFNPFFIKLFVVGLILIGAASWFIYKPHDKVIRIPEFGVQFTLPAGTLTDFKYVVSNVNYEDNHNGLGIEPTAYLGTRQLDALGAAATGVGANAPPLGFLTKTPGKYPAHSTADNSTGALVKQFPTFYISLRQSGQDYYDSSTLQKIKLNRQQLNSALKSLELIK
jgi:hypothetical protein